MKVVTQEVCAATATVAVVYTEEGASWPFFVASAGRLEDVEDNGHAVFIVIPAGEYECLPHNALVCVGCVRLDDSIAFD